MRKAITAVLLALLAICSLVVSAHAELMPNEVIAKFRPNIGYRTKAFVGSSLGLQQIRTVFSSDFGVYAVPPGMTPEAVIARLQTSPYVIYAERNPLAVVTAVPDDPIYRNQWSLHPPSAAEMGINLPDAWSVSTGEGVKVAVLDTGCAYENFDIYSANPDLNPGRVIAGWDFVNQDIHPNDDSEFGHGTHLSSLIADTANNALSGTGIAPGCTLMPLKCFDADGVSTVDRIASGLSYASRFGARVILIGGATAERSQCLQDMIDLVVAGGALVIAGAGNNGVNVPTTPGVHAVYNHVLYVAATAKDGSHAPYSNRGSYLSVSAPGGASGTEGPIAATYSPFDAAVPTYGLRLDGTSVQPMHGTSVAAAHVAGVAALVMGALPGIPASTVREQLQSTAIPLGDPNLYGAGLIDATAAVGAISTLPGGGDPGGGDDGGEPPLPGAVDAAVTELSLPAGPVVVGNSLTINVGLRNNSSETKTLTLTLQDETNGASISTQEIGLTPGQATTLSVPWTVFAPEGTHTVRASVSLPGDTNPSNNARTASIAVNPAQLQLRIAPSKPAYLLGEWIFVNFNATDGGLPAEGTKINYTIFGANGFPFVRNATATTNANGDWLMVLTTYYSYGGRGTYLIEATATRNGATTTARQTFNVLGARG